MSGIFGSLGMTEADRGVRINQIGEELVYEAAAIDLAQHVADLREISSMFIGEVTDKFKRTYKLPGSGYLQYRGRNSRPGGVKASGGWDVEWPLEDFGASLIVNDIALAYMTLQEFDRHLDTIMIQDTNTMRLQILRALFDNNAWTFYDETIEQGTNLTVKPLANNDSARYPTYASDSEAAANNYLASGYVTADIDNINNPVTTMTQKLEDYFGAPTGGSNVVMFVPRAVGAAIASEIDSFDDVPSRFISPGANTDIPVGLPQGLPGKVLGVCDSTWIVEWNRIPADYSLALHLDAPAPLVMRVDPADTGIPTGLHLFYSDPSKPLSTSAYRNRYGIGTGNRLNGVIMKFTAGSYTVPSGLTRTL